LLIRVVVIEPLFHTWTLLLLLDCALAVNAIMLNTAKSSCLIIEFFMTVDFEFCIVFEFFLI
jgi:hypothetical protein